jgi:hypothetical protein
MTIFDRILRLYSPDGASGGAGAPAGGAAPAAGGAASPAGGLSAPGGVGDLGRAPPAAGGNQPDGQPQPGAWKLPDGVPDHLRADSADAFAAKLFEDWGKQRGVISKFEPAKSVEDYVYTPSDKLKPFVGDLAKDPVFAIARDAALKAGVPKGAFPTFVGGVYESLVDKGLVPPPYDPVKERDAFFGDEARGLTEAQKVERLGPLLNGAQGFIASLVSDKVIDKGGGDQLLGLLDTANGAKAVLALQKAMTARGLTPQGGPGGDAGMSRDGLRARLADPRNDLNSAQYDRAFAEETNRLYQKFDFSRS